MRETQHIDPGVAPASDPSSPGSNDKPSALYKRLPRGPHNLPRVEVSRRQRLRLHGAMIEAVGTQGYDQTSVNEVVALAGVSRRSFYEHFSNKQECFLATYNVIVARLFRMMKQACRSREGDLEHQVHAALQALSQEIQTSPKALRLVLAETATAGPQGLARLHETLKMCEHAIGMSFFESSKARNLPRPIARALVGGLQRMVLHHLLEGNASQIPSLTDEMTKWITCFDTPTITRLSPDTGVLLAGTLDQHVRAEGRNDTVLSAKSCARVDPQRGLLRTQLYADRRRGGDFRQFLPGDIRQPRRVLPGCV